MGASSHAQDVFKNFLATTRRRKRNKENEVVYIIDAAYRTHLDGVLGFERPPSTYCAMRSAELTALGASYVSCVLLDPDARQRESRIVAESVTDADLDSAKSFANKMRQLTDSQILEKLMVASVVFVEGGNAFFLMTAM